MSLGSLYCLLLKERSRECGRKGETRFERHERQRRGRDRDRDRYMDRVATTIQLYPIIKGGLLPIYPSVSLSCCLSVT